MGRDPNDYGSIDEILAERRIMEPMGTSRIQLLEEAGQKFIRLNYPANPGNCRDDYVREPSIDFVGRGVREVWIETWVRPSANWTTQNGCAVGVDHKSFLVGTNQGAGGSPRFGFHVGYGGSPTTYDGTFPGSGDGNSSTGPYGSVFTGPDIRGRWTRVRMHYRLGTDGVADIWFGDQLVRSKRGVAMDAQSIDFITRGNLNQGPPVDMYIDWGATNVFFSNPGWPGQG